MATTLRCVILASSPILLCCPSSSHGVRLSVCALQVSAALPYMWSPHRVAQAIQSCHSIVRTLYVAITRARVARERSLLLYVASVWLGRESSVSIDRRLPVRAAVIKLDYDGIDDGSARGDRQRLGLRVRLSL